MLISAQLFRGTYNFRDETIQLDTYLNSASAEIKQWVGTGAYADAEKQFDEDSSTVCSNPERAYRLQLAEIYLAMYYAYPVLALQVETGVIVLSDRDEGQLVRQFLKPGDIEAGAAVYLEKAKELTTPYLSGTATRRPTSAVVKSKSRISVCMLHNCSQALCGCGSHAKLIF